VASAVPGTRSGSVGAPRQVLDALGAEFVAGEPVAHAPLLDASFQLRERLAAMGAGAERRTADHVGLLGALPSAARGWAGRIHGSRPWRRMRAVAVLAVTTWSIVVEWRHTQKGRRKGAEGSSGH